MLRTRSSFGRDLLAARDNQKPAMALRPHDDGTLDDVVVLNVNMFRAEQLDKGILWLCCYLANGERVTFDVVAERGSLSYQEGEMPNDWIDLDA